MRAHSPRTARNPNRAPFPEKYPDRRRRVLQYVCGMALAMAGTISNAREPQPVGVFQRWPDLSASPWHKIQIDPGIAQTRYRIREWDGVTAVEATADGSMTLLARPLSLDLDQTPVLCWLWRIDAALDRANMLQKEGDDYAARVYVAFDIPDDELKWHTRAQLALGRRIFGDQLPDGAINYIWDNRQPVGTRAANAYTGRARMLVLQSGNANAGRWIAQRRNILRDARQDFGVSTLTPTLLAIASDTDNTGEAARAGFADLHFVAETSLCSFSIGDLPPLAGEQ